jgi:hypothetical protein
MCAAIIPGMKKHREGRGMRMESRFFPVAVLAVAIPATASTIVGGEPIAIAEAPWQVLLDGGNCGGSWIGKNWVVTAVHCVASGGPDGAPIPNVGTFVNAGITRKSEADANNRYLPRKLHFPPGTRREWNTFIPERIAGLECGVILESLAGIGRH